MNTFKNKDGLTEAEFLAAYQPKKYPKPSVTADIVLFAPNDKFDKLKILLIRRGNHPYIFCHALPGGFVNINESCKAAARRELKEETGIDNIYIEQLCTASDPKRDPRMRVISVVYLALTDSVNIKPTAGDDAAAADWFEIDAADYGKVQLTNDNEIITYKYMDYLVNNGKLPHKITQIIKEDNGLAFDHAQLITCALQHLKETVHYRPELLLELMPKQFSLSDMQKMYNTLTDKNIELSHIKQLMQGYIKNISGDIYTYKGVDQDE